MSRIGQQPITIPSGVDVKIDGGRVAVKGPKGELEHTLVGGVSVDARRRRAASSSASTTRASNRSLHGLQRSLIANMVTGVSEGFAKELEIVGVGYRARRRARRRSRSRVGFSHPVHVAGARRASTFEVPQPTRIVVRGFDKQLVGQVAADIRKLRKPEPYKGKGIRYAGERVLRKAGKSAK